MSGLEKKFATKSKIVNYIITPHGMELNSVC